MNHETKSPLLDRLLRAIGLCLCVFIIWLWPLVIVWLVRRYRRSRAMNAPPIIPATTPPPLPPIIPPPLPPTSGNGGEDSPESRSFAA